MQNYLAKKRMDVQRAAPYTPEKNCVAERTNRTLMDMARSMLSHSGLPVQSWSEAVTTPSQIRNDIGKKASRMKIPLETRPGKKPYVGHFWPFGCQVMLHVLGHLGLKLDKRSREALLLRCLPHSICSSKMVYGYSDCTTCAA